MIIDKLNNNYIIVLDTNVLLGIYHWSPEFSEFTFECIKKVSNHIVLPSTVLFEYKKHCRYEFAKMERRNKNAILETNKQIKLAKEKIVASCGNLERLQYPDVDELRIVLEKRLDTVMEVLDEYFEKHAALELAQKSWNGKDYLNVLINGIEDEGRIMPALTQEEIYNWCEEGELRYKKEIPPGFMDAKDKDGVRKYSDYILWQEICRYSKSNGKNIIFVTDDVKADWWEKDKAGVRHFHSKLIDEFAKTGYKIIPMISQTFYNEVSQDYNIEKTDAIEIALKMTDRDYCNKIDAKVFELIEEKLMYDATRYIDEESSHIGTEGISEYFVTEHSLISAERVYREYEEVVYEFVYKLELEGTSYDYWGKDDDTKEVILSEGCDHIFEGTITAQVIRKAEEYYDFENDNAFESIELLYGELIEKEFEYR